MSFHAHPDDEALLTAGTLARATAEGHRVVLVTATDGAAGLATGLHTADGRLGPRRMAELRQAGAAIGCRDVRWLGYADSGSGPGGTDGPNRPVPTFTEVDPAEAARRLARILTETGADVLTVYDPAGGYGHPDHVRVHEVGTRAAVLAGTPVVLEATVDRRPLVRLLEVLERCGALRLLHVDREQWSPQRFGRAYSDPGRITHRVGTRRFAAAKRAAMAAHVTQAGGGTEARTLSVFLRLPFFVFARVFGHEWFVEQGRAPTGRPLDDIFASLRTASPIESPRRSDPG